MISLEFTDSQYRNLSCLWDSVGSCVFTEDAECIDEQLYAQMMEWT